MQRLYSFFESAVYLTRFERIRSMWFGQKKLRGLFLHLVRLERLELPTYRFVPVALSN